MKNTELDIIELDNRKQVVTRRITDARIWGAMSEEQQCKAERLVAGYMIATNGLRVTGANYERIGNSGRPTDASGASLMRQYAKWLAACAKNGLDPSATIYVLACGYSYATVDRATRRRRHTTRREMQRGLDLFE
jgi:hypothetical protein